jgi:hypothetical protein
LEARREAHATVKQEPPKALIAEALIAEKKRVQRYNPWWYNRCREMEQRCNPQSRIRRDIVELRAHRVGLRLGSQWGPKDLARLDKVPERCGCYRKKASAGLWYAPTSRRHGIHDVETLVYSKARR